MQGLEIPPNINAYGRLKRKIKSAQTKNLILSFISNRNNMNPFLSGGVIYENVFANYNTALIIKIRYRIKEFFQRLAQENRAILKSINHNIDSTNQEVCITITYTDLETNRDETIKQELAR